MIKGESYSFVIIFNEGYNTDRIQELQIVIGNIVVGKLSTHSIYSLSPSSYKCDLSGTLTNTLRIGPEPIELSLDDSIRGIIKRSAGEIYIENPQSKFTNSSINDGFNHIIEIIITEEEITIGNIYFDAIFNVNRSKIFSGSYSASITPENGFQVNTDTGITGSLNVYGDIIGHSLIGDGSQITNISASSINGLNLSQIYTGSYSASINHEGGLFVNTFISASSFTGSLYGTASNAVSSSYALSASLAENAVTASYSLVATSASYSQTSTSASISQNAITASYASTASYFEEKDPIFNASQAKNITSTHITVLNNTSGTNKGDQDLSGLVEKVVNYSLVPDTEIAKLAEYPAFEDLEFSYENLQLQINAVDQSKWEHAKKLGKVYGRLYSSQVSIDSRGVAPDGWRAATYNDWWNLFLAIVPQGNPQVTAGGILKSTGTTDWMSPNTGALDTYGFSILPAGILHADQNGQNTYLGTYVDFGKCAYFDCAGGSGEYIKFSYDSAGSQRSGDNTIYGRSIRLIKNDSTDPGTVLDSDGNVYDTVKIGNQVWTKQNLHVTHFNNGDLIGSSFVNGEPSVIACNGDESIVVTIGGDDLSLIQPIPNDDGTPVKVLSSFISGLDSYAKKTDIVQSDWNETDDTKPDFIKNKDAVDQSKWEQSIITQNNGIKYGRLYNWYAATDPRGIAPAGWHVPSQDEWQTLIDFVGGANVAGGKLKQSGTNDFQLNIFLSGLMQGIGNFYYAGVFAYFTTTTVWNESIRNVAGFSESDNISFNSSRDGEANSIRLIKDNSTNEGDVIIDGDTYHAVTIGTQVWLQQNLAVTHYQNGDLIGSDFSGTVGAVTAYNNDESNVYDIVTVEDTTHIQPKDSKRIHASIIDELPELPENIVTDANYVHTDNNYTDMDKTLLSTALQSESDPVYALDKDRLSNTSGVNTGDQDLSGLLPNSHLSDFNHSDINHANRYSLDLVSGINTGDQDLSGLVEKINNHSLVPDTEIDKLAEYPAFEDLEFSYENLTNKTSDIESNKTSVDKYPNAKGVVDYVAASQTETNLMIKYFEDFVSLDDGEMVITDDNNLIINI